MADRYDAVVVGAGPNGLAAATVLAGAGRSVLVLERRPVAGGALVGEEFHPGFHAPGPGGVPALWPRIAAELGMEDHGFRGELAAAAVFAPAPGGGGLTLWRDAGRSVEEARRACGDRDAQALGDHLAFLRRLARPLRDLLSKPAPDPLTGDPADLALVAGTGLLVRGLGRGDMEELLRSAPMAVADLVSDRYASELLRAVMAAPALRGVYGGPRLPLTGLNGYLEAAACGAGGWGATAPAGGMRTAVEALRSSLRARGGELRTGAEVEAIETVNGTATGVRLAGGERIGAGAVLSSCDPRRTFLELVGPQAIPPSLDRSARNYRMRGVTAQVDLAVSELPSFEGVPAGEAPARLGGAIHIGPTLAYQERALDPVQFGRPSDAPVLEARIPSLADPEASPPGSHVISIIARGAPHTLREGSWDEHREAFGDAVVAALAEHAPNLPGAVLARRVLAPPDIERLHGLTGGHERGGEHALDQLLFMRPFGGWARYRTPVAGLWRCGASTHPGAAIFGASGRLAARALLASD